MDSSHQNVLVTFEKSCPCKTSPQDTLHVLNGNWWLHPRHLYVVRTVHHLILFGKQKILAEKYFFLLKFNWNSVIIKITNYQLKLIVHTINILLSSNLLLYSLMQCIRFELRQQENLYLCDNYLIFTMLYRHFLQLDWKKLLTLLSVLILYYI